MEVSFQAAEAHLQAASADKQILELLSATKGFLQENLSDLSAKQLITIGTYFSMTEASIRMALSRQSKAGKLLRQKGRYMLAKNQKPFLLPRFWLDLGRRSMDWKYDWFLINAADTKFSTTLMRRLNQKAELLGLRNLPSLGWVRPNNLIDLKEEVIYHFSQVAPEINWFSAVLTQIPCQKQSEMQAGWPIASLNQFYTDGVQLMNEEKVKLAQLSDQDVLVRSFTVGRFIIHYLAQDPWLPKEMVDVEMRQKLTDQLIAYYQQIMPHWLKVLNQV